MLCDGCCVTMLCDDGSLILRMVVCQLFSACLLALSYGFKFEGVASHLQASHSPHHSTSQHSPRVNSRFVVDSVQLLLTHLTWSFPYCSLSMLPSCLNIPSGAILA